MQKLEQQLIEVTRVHMKVIREQMSVTNFVHRIALYFKNGIY
jgi:hypothetical protein